MCHMSLSTLYHKQLYKQYILMFQFQIKSGSKYILIEFLKGTNKYVTTAKRVDVNYSRKNALHRDSLFHIFFQCFNR